MKAYYRFFRVTQGPLIDAIDRIETEQNVVRKIWRAAKSKIGGDILAGRDGKPCAISLKPVNVDLTVWRRLGNYRQPCYWPKKSSAAGKAMLAILTALPRYPMTEDALKAVGLTGNLPLVIDGSGGWSAMLSGFNDLGLWFVRVPWRDQPKKEIDAYLKAKAKGSRFSLAMDHALWTPHETMVEIKEWEYLKEREETEALVKSLEKKIK